MDNNGGSGANLIFDLGVFSVDTIKRALYRFADICSFDIVLTGQKITVTVHVLIPTSKLATDELCFRIRNEVLDQDLRDTISKDRAHQAKSPHHRQ